MQKEYQPVEKIKTFADLKQHFENPPVEYRTAPFFVWHDKVSKQEIDRYLEDYKTKGIGGVFIHPRYGLVTEYLSGEWFDLIQYAVDKCKALGMQAWLYDENSFPSGFAGGHVPAEMPESYNQGAGLQLQKLSELPDDRSEYVVILKKVGDDFQEVDAAASGTGDYYAFKKAYYEQTKWYGGYSYVDLLADGVTEKFIEMTMRGYEHSIGSEFGKTVPGIFTDEPNISPPRRPRNVPIMRWTPKLFEVFQQRWGYDLKLQLPALFEEIGDWQRVRHNYYQVLLQMFIDRWSKPWYRYCENHNLQWTGHYWEHGWPDPHHGGDNMAMYAWHQTPGIDMLFNALKKRPDQFGNVHSVKELASVANQLGRKRTLSETYGAAGWELAFKDMKRLGDWEYVLGVNLMNQHLSYMTLVGDRKHDFPQSFSYHTPWWPYYKTLADYFARLSLALSSGEQRNHTLILEPTTTTWMYSSWDKSSDRLDEIGDGFKAFVEALESQHIEFDLGSENIIKDHGSVVDNSFIIGQRAYSLVVLPEGVESLDAATVKLVEAYLDNGGTVLSFAGAPKRVGGQLSGRLSELASTHPDQWITVASLDDEAVLERLQSKSYRLIATDKNERGVYHMRRELADGQLLFLTNFSLESEVTVKCSGVGTSAYKLDALSGDISLYPVETKENTVEITATLPPAGSLMLFISNSAPNRAVPMAEEKRTLLDATSPVTVKRLNANVLTIDYCDLKLQDQEEHGIYFYSAGTKIWQAHGFDANPWVSSSQYKTDILDRGNFAEGTGFDVTYHFNVMAGVDADSLQAVIERPALWQVSINGQSIDAKSGEWWLDRAFGRYDIGRYVQTGDNTITLSTHPMNIMAELEPIYVIGNFQLMTQPHGWQIVPDRGMILGEWRQQGLPFYSQGVAYSKTYALRPGQKYLVQANNWVGTMVAVSVNDQPAGIIAWAPNELDISQFVKDGENKISLSVLGSLKNTLGPHHNVTQRGIVTPWSFKYAPESQPAGLNYDLDGYGMFADFQLFEIN